MLTKSFSPIIISRDAPLSQNVLFKGTNQIIFFLISLIMLTWFQSERKTHVYSRENFVAMRSRKLGRRDMMQSRQTLLPLSGSPVTNLNLNVSLIDTSCIAQLRHIHGIFATPLQHPLCQMNLIIGFYKIITISVLCYGLILKENIINAVQIFFLIQFTYKQYNE